MATACSNWGDLDGKAQEHVASFLGINHALPLRAASSSCRQLVNHKVTALKLYRLQVGPIRTLQLPSRFPNLGKLALWDFLSDPGGPIFTAEELLHLFDGSQQWGKLMCLDVRGCREASVLVLAAILTALPKLQCVKARLPSDPRVPGAVAASLAQLSNLQTLKLHPAEGVKALTLAELLHLTSAQSLRQLRLGCMEWQAMRVVGALQNLTSLKLLSPDGSSRRALDRLTQLTNLQHFELTTNRPVDCSRLAVMLASISSLRSFQSEHLACTEGPLGVAIAAIAAVTQLTRIRLYAGECDSPDDDLCATFERCMQMPNLQELSLFPLDSDNDIDALSVAAACAQTLKTLRLSMYDLHAACALVKSAAFRSLKLMHLELRGIVFVEEDEEEGLMQECLMEALCTQTALRTLNLNLQPHTSDDHEPCEWPDDMWARIGRHCTALTDLSIDGCPVKGLGSLPSLQHLCVIGHSDMQDVEVVHLFPCRQLQTLKFHFCSALTRDAVAALAVALPRLQKICMANCSKYEWDADSPPRPDLEVSVCPY